MGEGREELVVVVVVIEGKEVGDREDGVEEVEEGIGSGRIWGNDSNII